MPTSALIGSAGKLYWNATPDTADASVTTEATNIQDAQLNYEIEKADTTTRANAGYRSEIAVLVKPTISFKMLWSPGDPFFDQLRAKAPPLAANRIFTASFYDQARATSGAKGFHANWNVTKFDWSQNLTEAQMVDVELSFDSLISGSPDGDGWYTT